MRVIFISLGNEGHWWVKGEDNQFVYLSEESNFHHFQLKEFYPGFGKSVRCKKD
jgi:hypothetical protein